MSFSEVVFRVGLFIALVFIATILGYARQMRRADERRLESQRLHPAGKGLTADYEPGHTAEEIASVINLVHISRPPRGTDGVFSQ